MEEAAAYYQQSYQLKADLLELQPNNLSLRQDMADTLSWQSNIEAKKGDLKRAISLMLEVKLELTNIYSESSEISHLETLSHTSHLLASNYLKQGYIAESMSNVIDTQKFLEKLRANDEQNTFYLINYIWSLLLETRLLILRKSFDLATVRIQRVTSILGKIDIDKENLIELAEVKVLSNLYKAQIHDALGHTLSAESHILLSVKLYDEYLDPSTHLHLYSNLALSLINFINESENISFRSQKRLEKSAEELMARLSEKPRDIETIYWLIHVNARLGRTQDAFRLIYRYQLSDFRFKHYINIRSSQK